MTLPVCPGRSPKTGAELRAWRERLGWTQLTLSINADVDQVTVWRAEQGRFSSAMLWKLLAALKAGETSS
jgi:transcriptional regulator with XRE-family HTH domain